MRGYKSFGILDVSIIFVSSYLLIPQLLWSDPFRVIVLIMETLMLIKLVSLKTLFAKKWVTILVLFSTYKIVLGILLNEHFSIVYEFEFITFILIIISSFFARKYSGMKSAHLVINWIVFLTLINALIQLNFNFDLDRGSVVRYLAKSSEISEYLNSRGIIGYSGVYFIVCYLPLLWGFYFEEDKSVFGLPKSLDKIMNFVMIVLANIYLLKADFVIAIGISLLLQAILLLKKRPVYLFFLAVIISTRGLPEYGRSLSRKIEDTSSSIESGASVGTFHARWERYSRSAGHIVRNPIFGSLVRDDLGKHSTILDICAQYGLIGLVYIKTILLLPFSLIKIKREYKLYQSLTFIGLVLIALLNNVPATIAVVLGVVLPVFSESTKGLNSVET